jgi:hypothetical protein
MQAWLLQYNTHFCHKSISLQALNFNTMHIGEVLSGCLSGYTPEHRTCRLLAQRMPASLAKPLAKHSRHNNSTWFVVVD